MDQFVQDADQNTKSIFSPKTDIAEDEKGFSLEMALPGMKKEDIQIEILRDSLSISGERKFKNEESGKKYHRIESSFGSFKRTFSLPEHAGTENIEAKFEDGVLHVFIPKNEKLGAKSVVIK